MIAPHVVGVAAARAQRDHFGTEARRLADEALGSLCGFPPPFRVWVDGVICGRQTPDLDSPGGKGDGGRREPEVHFFRRQSRQPDTREVELGERKAGVSHGGGNVLGPRAGEYAGEDAELAALHASSAR